MVFTEVLTILGIYFGACVLFGILVNLWYLPKGSTIKDVLSPSEELQEDEHGFLHPILMYLAPGINFLFIIGALLCLFCEFICWVCNILYKVNFIKKFVNFTRKGWSKIISIKVK